MMDWLSAILSTALWPFSVRPSLANLADPEMRRLVATALSELGFALLLVAITTLMRRARVVAMLVALPLVFTQVPSLALLLVPATQPVITGRPPALPRPPSLPDGRYLPPRAWPAMAKPATGLAAWVPLPICSFRISGATRSAICSGMSRTASMRRMAQR